MNSKRSMQFLGVIAAILIIVLAVFGWNISRKEPIDLNMYGAEIKADGTVLTETEFLLSGYLIDNSKDQPYQPWKFYLKPITFKNIPDYSVNMESFDTELTLFFHGDANNPNYAGPWICYSSRSDDFEKVSYYWSGDFSCCIIGYEGRWIVGSTDPAMSVSQILAKLPEVTLE